MVRRGFVKISRLGSFGVYSLSMISYYVLVFLWVIEDCVVVVRICIIGKVGFELLEVIVCNVVV